MKIHHFLTGIQITFSDLRDVAATTPWEKYCNVVWFLSMISYGK